VNLPGVNEAINQALEVAPQGVAGVSGTVEGHGITKSGIAPILEQSGQSEYQASPADSQTCFSSLDHYTNRITRCVDKKLGRETEVVCQN